MKKLTNKEVKKLQSKLPEGSIQSKYCPFTSFRLVILDVSDVSKKDTYSYY